MREEEISFQGFLTGYKLCRLRCLEGEFEPFEDGEETLLQWRKCSASRVRTVVEKTAKVMEF